MSQRITSRIDRHLANLFSLTSTAFDFNEVKGMCLGWGWRLDYEMPDSGVAWFIPEAAAQACLESREGGGIDGRAYLWFPLDYWPPDEDNPSAGANPGDGSDEGRREFGIWFEAALERIRGYLGEPAGSGRYEYPHRKDWPYSYAIWRGDRGVLLLQQDERDIQFGFDLSIWVLSAGGRPDLPSLPLGGEHS